MVEMQFRINIYFLYFFQKVVSYVFNVMGSSFQTLGAETEKVHLSKLTLVLGIISCCEMDDLSCLRIFERCRRLVMLCRWKMTYESGQFKIDSISNRKPV